MRKLPPVSKTPIRNHNNDLILFFSHGGYAPLVPDPISEDLSVYFKFEDNLLRSYGTNNASSANTTFVDGAVGKAIDFTGTDSFALVDPSADFNLEGGDFTIITLINPSVTGVAQWVLGQGDYQAGNSSLSFYFQLRDTNLLWGVIRTASGFVVCESDTVFSADTWYLCILKRSGNTLTLKVNDVQEDSETLNVDVNTSLHRLGFGSLGEFRSSNSFNGLINYFAIIKRAITTDEETWLYNGGSFRKFVSASPTTSANPLKINCIDPYSIGFSTFNTNNQRVVNNANGAFYIYVFSSASSTSWDWNLYQTTNGGITNTLIYTGNSYDATPVLETDSSGNLYVMYDATANTAKLLKFSEPSYGAPTELVTVTGILSHKHAMLLDEARDRIYFTTSGEVVILDMAGNIISQTQVLQDGPNAGAEYPHLTIDGSGNVYLGWSTAVPASNSGYFEWRWIVLRSGVWEKADGTNLTLPVVSDDTGDSEVIEAVEGVVSKWMSGFIYANERLHAVGWTDQATPEQRYHTINPNTAALTNSTDFIFGADADDFADGSFIRSNPDGTVASPQPIYFVSVNGEKISSLKTTDNGVTWGDLKQMDGDLPGRKYSIAPFREVYNGKVSFVFTSVSTAPAIAYTDEYTGFTYAGQLTT